MVYATLNEDMVDLLKNLKFSTFISYECEKTFDSAYGNLRINTDKGSIEVTNFEKTMPFFDIEEEIACFECKISEPNTEFKPYCIVPSEIYEIGQNIVGIEIINDFISVNDGEYEISFDRAIIFKTDKEAIMFSRGIWFSEVITISKNDDYDNIYSIDEVIEAWSNEGDNKVNVHRSIRQLW